MSTFSFSQLAIKSVAAAVPAHVHTFDQSSRRAARFSKQMGIYEVHISVTEQTALDLGYVALKQALAHVGWQAQDLDLLIFDTQTPDFRGAVGDSLLLHKYLQLKESCAVFDMTMGCAALPYLITVAGSLMNSSPDLHRAAILTGDSKWINFKDTAEIEATAAHLSGEGTGVMLLERAPAAPLTTQIFAQGQGYLHLFNLPSLKNTWQRSEEYILPDGARWHVGSSNNKNYMNGMAIHEFVTGPVCDHIKKLWGDKLDSFDYVVFNQSNQQMLDCVCANLKLSPEKMLTSLKHYGNTSCASPLVTICDHSNELNAGAHLFSACSGIGLTWGFMDYHLPANAVLPIIPTDHRFTEHMLQPVTSEA